MGLIDKKTRIIDFCLTEKGRDLLAQNKLQIKHYAFSDDLIDYSGSLAQSLKASSSIDDIVYRNYVPIEATSMAGSSPIPRDLGSFLYTCPEQRASLPPFELSRTTTGSLMRVYKNVPFGEFVVGHISDDGKTEVVMTTTRDDTAASDRENQYASQQDLKRLPEADPFYVSIVK